MSDVVPRLPALSVELLESVYQHRLLSTRQVHHLHTPESSRRWTQQLLNLLADRELLGVVQGAGAAKLWFVTEAGADAVEAIPTRAEQRRKVVTPEQAAGQLQQHTLAVNEAGIAYVKAARERGDECGPLAWRHEVAHPIGRGSGRRHGGELVIADALLTYLQAGAETVEQHQRFLELDRGTIPIDALLGKLHRYQRLRDYTIEDRPRRDGQPAWRAHYQRLPAVQIVLAHRPRCLLERRLQLLLALYASDPDLADDDQLEVAVALLDDLQAHGPFAEIWIDPRDPSRRRDWLSR